MADDNCKPDKLILILGDQLSSAIPSLQGADRKRDVVLMCEVAEECGLHPSAAGGLMVMIDGLKEGRDGTEEIFP